MTESLRAQLDRWRDLTTKQVNAAAARALNRTATSTRAELARAVKDELPALKIGTIKDTMTIEKASRALSAYVQQAVITVKAKAIPLVAFAARTKVVKTKRGRRVGVTVSVKDGRQLVPGGFMASVGATAQIFKRKGAGRLPIKKLWGPSVAAIARSESVMGKIVEYARRTFRENFERELKYQSTRGAGE